MYLQKWTNRAIDGHTARIDSNVLPAMAQQGSCRVPSAHKLKHVDRDGSPWLMMSRYWHSHTYTHMAHAEQAAHEASSTNWKGSAGLLLGTHREECQKALASKDTWPHPPSTASFPQTATPQRADSAPPA